MNSGRSADTLRKVEMANIRKRRGKWNVTIRKNNYPAIYKTFIDKPILKNIPKIRKGSAKTLKPIVNSKPSYQEEWDVIDKFMSPSERREFYRNKPAKDKPKDLYKDVPKFNYEGLTKEFREVAKNFPNIDKPLEIKKPDFSKKKDIDLQSGLGFLLDVSIKDDKG